MADGWAFARMFLSESARRKALPAWLHEYNHHRPHTAIGNRPPITRLTNLSGQYKSPTAAWFVQLAAVVCVSRSQFSPPSAGCGRVGAGAGLRSGGESLRQPQNVALRGYLSTAAKHGRSPFDVLTELTSGNVWIPATS
jgi:hypothetical protein